MVTYKLLRMRGGKLYPLYVEPNRELPIGEWLDAQVGPAVDETHVKARSGILSLRPGFHSTDIPFADWIGVRVGESLCRRPGDVWCECEVIGNQVNVEAKNGLRQIPDGWYYFRTNPKQIRPWIISDRIKIVRVLSDEEVDAICYANGVVPQPLAV